jgi:hypothetical protein
MNSTFQALFILFNLIPYEPGRIEFISSSYTLFGEKSLGGQSQKINVRGRVIKIFEETGLN